LSNLALDLRPSQLRDVAGNETTKRAIQSFIDTKNFPNVILLVGPSGTGKTTLAEIIVREAGCDPSAIHQINGSDKNGVDDARELVDMAGSVPFSGSRRAFIINECQRMTSNALDCLLEPMEKTPALWVLTSTDPSKIIPAVKSRAAAATFNLLPLTDSQIKTFLTQFSDLDDRTLDFLRKHDIRAPREILGILDQYYSGLKLEECSLGDPHEPLYKDVAGAILSGNWTKASAALAQIKTADARGLIGITSAFFRSELLKCPIGPRADALATCLVGLDSTGFADGSAYGSVCGLLYKACKAMGAK
jgi:DNA polymerase III gamma/tau subunit